MDAYFPRSTFFLLPSLTVSLAYNFALPFHHLGLICSLKKAQSCRNPDPSQVADFTKGHSNIEGGQLS